MCMVSVIGDLHKDKFTKPPYAPDYDFAAYTQAVTRAEFEALRKEVSDMKKLLEMAKDYDRKHNEPNCEVEEKMSLLRKVAKAVGVDLDEVLKDKA